MPRLQRVRVPPNSRNINPRSPSERLTSSPSLQESVGDCAAVSFATGSAERAAPLGVSPCSSAHGGPRRCGAQMMITALRCMLRTSLLLLERQRQILPTKSPSRVTLSFPLSLFPGSSLYCSVAPSLSLSLSLALSQPPPPRPPTRSPFFPLDSVLSFTHYCQFHTLRIAWKIHLLLL